MNSVLQKTDDIRIIIVPNALERDKQIRQRITYTDSPLSTIAAKVLPPNIEFVATINGIFVDKTLWENTFPVAGDYITFVDKPGFFFLAPALIAALTPALGVGLATVGVYAGLAIGSYYLMRSLTPKPKTPKEIDRTGYSWNAQTLQNQNTPVSRIYGKVQTKGNVINWYGKTEVTRTRTRRFGSGSKTTTDQAMNFLVDLGRGPIQSVSDFRLNDQPIGNFKGTTVETRLGLANDDPISFFDKCRIQYEPQLAITQVAGPQVYPIPDDDYDDIELAFYWPNGLWLQRSSGDIEWVAITLKIELAEQGTEDWVTCFNSAVGTASTKPWWKEFTLSSYTTITRGTKYKIRVTRISSDTIGNTQDAFWLQAVRTVLNTAFTYPGHALVGIHSVASNMISGNLDFSCVVEGAVVHVYDGNEWTWEYSNDPAWIALDIASRPLLTGDGTPEDPWDVDEYEGCDPATRINLDKLWEISQYSCNEVQDGKGWVEPRFTFNYEFKDESNVWEALLDVGRVARFSPIYEGNKLTFVLDKPATEISQMFTVSSIVQDSFRETFISKKQRISELTVEYTDENEGWEVVPISFIDSSLSKYSNSKKTLNYRAITFPGQAWRQLWWHLKQNYYITRLAEYDASIASLVSQTGDRIGISHDLPNWGSVGTSDDNYHTGGRIVAVDQDESTGDDIITIDTDLEAALDESKIYEIAVGRIDCDKPLIGIIKSVAGKVITLDGSLRESKNVALVVLEGNNPVLIGINDHGFATGDAVLLSGISGISPTLNGSYVITKYDEDYFYLNDTRSNRYAGTYSSGGSAKVGTVRIGDEWTIGLQNYVLKWFTITGLRRKNDSTATLSLTEYKDEVYAAEDEEPDLPTVNVASPKAAKLSILQRAPTWDSLKSLADEASLGVGCIDETTITNITWNSNCPSAGYIDWSATPPDDSYDEEGPIILTFKGQPYAIADGNTNKKYIYWDESSPEVFQTTDTQSETQDAGCWPICFNNDGIADPAWGQRLINTKKVVDNAITDSGSGYAAGQAQLLVLTWSTLMTVTFTTTGGVLKISASAMIESERIVPGEAGEDQFAYFGVQRVEDNTWPWTSEKWIDLKRDYARSVSFNFLDSPPAGTYTYRFRGQRENVGNMTVFGYNRSLVISEMKK